MAPTKARKRRTNFIERTLAGFTRRLDRALYAEELAKLQELLQRLDPRVRVVGLLLLVIDVALARNARAIVAIFVVAILLALLSHVPLRTLVLRVWLSAFVFTVLIALPAIFITAGRAIYKLPLLGWTVTAQGLSRCSFCCCESRRR